MSASSLADRLLARDPRAIARAISLIEDESPAAAALVAQIYPRTGRAYVVGVTGPPGAGKSTLVDRLTAELRASGATVGVLAVDPTSPYSGGAILGDRVRMQAHAEDADVFIRSMATRGHLGGLARTTAEAATVLDAAGFDYVVIETVGVGQDEVDVVRTADIAIVTVVPGTGDEVQALKAGIMEIADIFVVNKADREGADRTAASIDAMLSLEHWPDGKWRPPVMRTVATTGAGVPELVAMIAKFRDTTGAGLGERRRARAEWRLREVLGRTFMQHLETHVFEPGEYEHVLERIASREVDPYTAAERVMARAIGQAGGKTGEEAGGTLDHVGIAVSDPSTLMDFFAQTFQTSTDAPEEVEGQRSQVRFIHTGGARLELVEALGDDAPIAKFLKTRGPGLHHVAFRVSDVRAMIAGLTSRGVRMIDEEPRRGAHGALIAFVHPSSCGGVLVELKQVQSPARL